MLSIRSSLAASSGASPFLWYFRFMPIPSNCEKACDENTFQSQDRLFCDLSVTRPEIDVSIWPRTHAFHSFYLIPDRLSYCGGCILNFPRGCGISFWAFRPGFFNISTFSGQCVAQFCFSTVFWNKIIFAWCPIIRAELFFKTRQK
jgi:hypothetical protein